ncbi:hypothetical protein GWI33_013533 [Rhynchophorus ferrugineus]|uniref:tRNA-specific adenosine deaminase 1 n=1 Tax=Rhynchophorus ferrugineus TaxID=354439 RepID=A0A834M7R9_RHYFE|nr:hypothetical protein GWI33_013533 [Rhynchophorus ferrugineus]
MLPDCDKDNIHTTIASLCLKHFHSLPKSGKPQENEWTVLSCIVKEQQNEFQVVALAKKRKVDIDEDIYRTGAKCLSNSIKQDLKEKGERYHILGVVRIKPGRGDPTVSVSCSDKISKWSHMGIQGALLMTFIENPIYLSTFTIVQNTPFCKEALKRALYGRLVNLNLKLPFGENCMCIKQVDVSFAYCKTNEKQPCPSSIYWFSNGKRSCLEVSVNGKKQGVTKKHLHTEKARVKICKLEFFNMFVKKLDEYGIKLYENIENKELSYKTAKESCKDYKLNWDSLKQSFGSWTLKNDLLLNFKLEKYT